MGHEPLPLLRCRGLVWAHSYTPRHVLQRTGLTRFLEFPGVVRPAPWRAWCSILDAKSDVSYDRRGWLGAPEEVDDSRALAGGCLGDARPDVPSFGPRSAAGCLCEDSNRSPIVFECSMIRESRERAARIASEGKRSRLLVWSHRVGGNLGEWRLRCFACDRCLPVSCNGSRHVMSCHVMHLDVCNVSYGGACSFALDSRGQ